MLSTGISEFAKENGFFYTSGARAYFSPVGAVYGEYKGVRLVVVHDSREFHQTCRIYAPVAEAEGLDYKLGRLLRDIAELPWVQDAGIAGDHCLSVTLFRHFAPAHKEDIAAVAEAISEFFRKNKLHSGCCLCGAVNARYIGLHDIPYFVCGDCEKDLPDFALETVEIRKKQPLRLGAGTAGAFLFSLGGLAIWVLMVAVFGKLAAVAGFFIAFGAMKGFLFFRGRLNGGTSLVILAVSLIVLLASQYISVLIMNSAALGEVGGPAYFIGSFRYMLSGAVRRDLLLGCVFVLAAWGAYLLGLFRKPKNSIGYTSDK